MSTKLTEEMLRKRFPPVKDPEILARRRLIVRVLMEEASPEEKAELLDPRVEEELIEKGIENGIEKGRIIEARVALRRVLARRQLALTPEQEARIDQCEEAAILERWHDQAVTAATAAEALV